jgi:hypothetical protein
MVNLKRILSAHVILTWAFFFFIKEGCPQTITFNKAIDNQHYVNAVDFSYSILNIGDSLYWVSSPSWRFPNNENSLIVGICDTNGLLKNMTEIFYVGNDYFTGYSGCMINHNNSKYLCGSVKKIGTSFQNAYLAKFNQIGDTTFIKEFQDSVQVISSFNSLILSRDNNIFTVGTIGSNFSNRDVLVQKTDTSGNLIWKKSFGGLMAEEAYSIIENNSTSILLFGRKHSNIQNNYPWVLKIDSIGNLIDEKWFIGGNGHPKVAGGFSATKGINDDIVVTGSLDTIINVGDAQYPIFFGIMDTNFNFNIKYAFNGAYPVRPYIIKQIKDSSYVAVGYKEGAITGCIAKISKDGELLWQREYIYKQYGFNYFADFQETKDGGFIITGATNGDTSQDMWLVKLDSLGLLNDSLIVNTGTVLANSSTNILQLYPNPAKEQLHLKIFFTQPQNEMAMLTVYDMVGKQILSENIILQQGKANHTINVSNLPGGNYIALVQAGGEVVKQRFVRE